MNSDKPSEITLTFMPPPPPTPEKTEEFREGIENLINRFSMENGCNTPDFILAEYLTDCLATFDKAVKRRSEWYGQK